MLSQLEYRAVAMTDTVTSAFRVAALKNTTTDTNASFNYLLAIRNIFSVLQFDQILLPVDNLQHTVSIKFTNVAGAEPSVQH
jgi:hypothetical protein